MAVSNRQHLHNRGKFSVYDGEWKPMEQEYPFAFVPGDDTFQSMKATNWEFTNRATVFGLIFGFTFPLYAFDHPNSTLALANWLGASLQMDADLAARFLFALVAFGVVVAALLIRSYAMILKLKPFFAIPAASLVLFCSSVVLQKKSDSKA
jgi:hypothetical protein